MPAGHRAESLSVSNPEPRTGRILAVTRSGRKETDSFGANRPPKPPLRWVNRLAGVDPTRALGN